MENKQDQREQLVFDTKEYWKLRSLMAEDIINDIDCNKYTQQINISKVQQFHRFTDMGHMPERSYIDNLLKEK